MRKLSLIGFILALGALIFGLYIMFVVVPASDYAAAEMDNIIMNQPLDSSTSYFEIPEYAEAFEISEQKVDMSVILLLGSIVPFLLCVYPAIKKNLLGIVGLILSLAAFFIGAAYGTHMFS